MVMGTEGQSTETSEMGLSCRGSDHKYCLWVAGEVSIPAREAAVPVQRSDPKWWSSHWCLVSSGRTLQLEGGTSKPWLCTGPRVSQWREILSMLEELHVLGRAGELISLFEP